jgi:hypothetical protein
MSEPNVFLYIALIAYVPFVAACFWILGGRRGMLVSLLAGWLFLPWFSLVGRSIPLLHGKDMFVPAIVLAASLLLDRQAWRRFRPRLLDLPVAVICLSPLFTSIANDYGWYDGGSGVFETSMKWGGPYLLGRVYLGSPAALLEASRALVVAGLAYVPVCLWEVRMSPQLHRQVYGFHQHSFAQHIRDGHYRPMAFMAHGLMVSMFMASAALVAFWLWRSRSVEKFLGIRAAWVVAVLTITTVLCRSVGALALLVLGMGILEVTRRIRSPVLILALALLPVGYCTVRVADWDAMPLVIEAERWLGPNRAESLRIRVVNDRQLTIHAMNKPWLGWGRWKSFRIQDEEGRDTSIVDSMWILKLGTGGLVSLIATGIFLALPLLLMLRAIPASQWGHRQVAPVAALAVVVGLWAVDDLLNAMMSPVFPLLAGAVVSFYLLAVGACTRRRVVGPARAAAPLAVKPSPG